MLDFGLLDVQTNEIPQSVNKGVRLVIRALQISARKEHGKPYNELVLHFNTLLVKTGKSEPLSTFVACGCAGIALVELEPDTLEVQGLLT